MDRSDTIHSIHFGDSLSRTGVFAPDASVKDSPPSQDAWRVFLDALSPRCLSQTHEGAAAIPLHKGVWRGDIIFSDTTLLLDLPPEIRAIEGSLAARGAAGLGNGWSGPLLVGRHLVLGQRLFLETPPKIRVRGDVSVWDAKSPEDLRLPPERFLAWGGTPGKCIRLRTWRFLLRETIPGDPSTMQLEDMQDKILWNYQRGSWAKNEKNLVSPELHEEIFQRLQRVCKIAGLGAAFVVHSPRKTGFNLRRMGSYFRLLARAAAQKNSASTTAEEAESLLADMDQNIHAENVDPPNIRIMLSVMDDRFAHALHMENTAPRSRVSEEVLASDMQWLEVLRCRSLTMDQLFRSPHALGIFLDRALHSQAGANAVSDLLCGIPKYFRSLRESCDLDPRLGLEDFLHDPQPVLDAMEARADDATQFLSLEALERALPRLKDMRPKDMIRTVFCCNCMTGDLPDDAARDKRLLSALHSFDGCPDALPLNKDQLLGLFLAEIRSPIVDALKELEQERRTGEQSRNKAVRVFAANLERLPLKEFAEFLRRRMEWEADIIRTFNEQAVRPAPKQVPKEDKAIGGLPPGLLKEVQGRCGRLCIIFGLGREFLDLRTEKIGENLSLLVDILSECLKHPQDDASQITLAPRKEHSGKNDRHIRGVVKKLEMLGKAVENEQEDQTRQWLEQLNDATLREAASAARTPRKRLDGSSLRRDLGLLALLQTDDVTLPTLLGTPREAMRFLASALNSPVAKKLLVRQAAKIKKAIDQFLGLSEVDAPRFNLSNILNGWGELSKSLEKHAPTYEAQMRLDNIHEALRELDETDLQEIITNTLTGLSGSKVEDEVRDRNMLLALSRFETGNLRAAGLRATSMGMLLLTRLTPVGADAVKKVFGEVEDAADKSAFRLVQLAQAEMKRRLTIVDGYNQITPPPRKRPAQR